MNANNTPNDCILFGVLWEALFQSFLLQE